MCPVWGTEEKWASVRDGHSDSVLNSIIIKMGACLYVHLCVCLVPSLWTTHWSSSPLWRPMLAVTTPRRSMTRMERTKPVCPSLSLLTVSIKKLHALQCTFCFVLTHSNVRSTNKMKVISVLRQHTFTDLVKDTV